MHTGLRHFLADPVANWRSGTEESQRHSLLLLMLGVSVSFVGSVLVYALVPVTAFVVWLLLGMLILRFRQLRLLSAWIAVAGVAGVLLDPPVTGVRISATISLLVSLAIGLYASSRQRSGLPGPVGEAMLADLRDRLQAQARVPELPNGWHTETAMIAAYGAGYGGDFLVADLSEDQRHLEMILVDVCGKGVGAATEALQFAGALGGLIGSLPPVALFSAANAFLLRQPSEETFATAVHVLLDLETGCCRLTSAGHPPALVWSSSDGAATRTSGPVWRRDPAHGLALGVMHRPDLESSTFVLRAGEALMFYTDGVVESRQAELDEGIAWLQDTAATAAGRGFPGAARRIIRQVERGDDDRAVLLLWRDATTAS